MLNIYAHTICLQHALDPKHPESPQRLEKVLSALKSVPHADFVEAPLATDGQLLLFHTRDYLDRLVSLCPNEPGIIVKTDADTGICKDSLLAAKAAAGAVCRAVDDVINNNIRKAFCAIRPPGHHALPGTSMGFCIYNNIAIGAAYALQKGCKKVAVIDFDVHHANGTQVLAVNNPNVLLISLHQCPLWPGSGERDEVPNNNILNIPFAPHTPREAYMNVFRNEALPKLEEFQPELILVSAGFDAHLKDPPQGVLFNDLPGYLCLLDEDYAELARLLCHSADKLCNGKLVAAMEGGYNTDVLAKACKTFVENIR